MRLDTARFFPFASGRTPLVAFSAGPVSEGQGGSRDNVWAWWVEPSGVHHLSNLSSSLSPALFPPPSYTVDLDASALLRVSLEFDQNNRRVLAWQINQMITLSYIETGVPEVERRVSWQGLEPVLWWDGLALEDSDLTDIHCYYLSTDRFRLCYRLQSDLYAVEYTWLNLPRAMAIADWKAVGRQFGLELADSDGNVYDVLSELYPTYVRDKGNSGGRLRAGAYRETILVRDPYAEFTLSWGGLTGGEHRLTILTSDFYWEVASSEGRLARGSYRLQGQLFDPVQDSGNASGRFEGGAYRLVFVSSGDPVTEFSRSSGRLARGSYRLASQPFDAVADAINWGPGRLRGGSLVQRLIAPVEADIDATRVSGRLSGGVLAETNRIQRFFDEAIQGGRLARGTFEFNPFVTTQVADAALMAGRLRGGLYAPAPTLYPYYDLFLLVDGGEGPQGEAHEYMYGLLGGY